MMNHSPLRYLLAPFVVLGLAWPLAEGPGGSQAATEAATIEAAAAVFEPLSPEELWAHPGRYVGKRVQITLQVHSHPKTWNPFMTRFGPAEFSCLLGWSDGQQPWRKREFGSPGVRVFARRGSAAEWALEDAQRYQRFELSCEVRAVLGDVPWLEVVGAKPLLRKISDGVVMHAARGLDFMDKQLWDAARLELERAQGGALPEPVLVELQRLIDVCVKQLDRPVLRPYKRPE